MRSTASPRIRSAFTYAGAITRARTPTTSISPKSSKSCSAYEAQGIALEAANPRHAHEWAVWKDIALPDDKLLLPGVIDTSTNYVEHPALVAERIVKFAGVVGRERVIANTDCGFGTAAGHGKLDPEIVYLKLARSLPALLWQARNYGASLPTTSRSRYGRLRPATAIWPRPHLGALRRRRRRCRSRNRCRR